MRYEKSFKTNSIIHIVYLIKRCILALTSYEKSFKTNSITHIVYLIKRCILALMRYKKNFKTNSIYQHYQFHYFQNLAFVILKHYNVSPNSF